MDTTAWEGPLWDEHLPGPREGDPVCTDGEVGKQISVVQLGEVINK